MNSTQAPQGQQVPQQQPQQQRPMLFRPEHMRSLPDKFSTEEKKKWENGLSMLYKQIEQNPPESQQHRDAVKKIRDFSIMLHSKVQASAQNRPPVNPNQPRPQSQGLPQHSQPDGNAPLQAAPSQPQSQPQPLPPRPMPSEPMRNHINSFPYIAPSNFPPGSNEAMQWIQQMKEKYMKALMAMESSAGGLKRIEAQVAARNQEGKTLSPEEQKDIAMKKEQMQRAHADSKRFVETFRRQQAEAAAAQGQQAGGGPQQAQQPQHPQQQGPSAITVPPRPTMNLQQPAQSQAMQQTEAVQAAMQAARNQQVNGGRPPVNLQSAGLSINEQMQQQNQQQAINAGAMPNMPPGQGPQPNIKVEGGPSQPHINTSIATAPHIQQMQARQAAAQGSPHSAAPHSAIPQSATSVGPPKPLTHSAAVAHAARTYSSGQTASTNNLMASHSHPPLPRDAPNIKTNLMPIPKQLPPGAIGPLHPVQMPPARPTYSGGPSGSGSGLMQQPAMTKPPGFTIEGDAERVLNKRKLDELVRQVTGGGEGLDNSEGLTPEVEDVSFIFLPLSISASISSRSGPTVIHLICSLL